MLTENLRPDFCLHLKEFFFFTVKLEVNARKRFKKKLFKNNRKKMTLGFTFTSPFLNEIL